jgi:hypothetical protein
MYYYRFYLFSEKFRENGTYFVSAFVVIMLLLVIIPYVLFKRNISKKGIKRILETLETLLNVGGIVIIIGGLSLSSLFIGADHYSVGPMLTWGIGQDPSTQITVLWRTSKVTPSIVYYGTSRDNLNLSSPAPDEVEWHQVALTNLTPNTTYYYRVEGLSVTQIHSFITAPIGDQDFSFIVFSDTRQNTSPLNTILVRNIPKWMMQNMRAQGTRPAFTLNCGDVTTYATENASWRSWFRDVSESGMASEAALQIAPGNHEFEYNDTGEILDSLYPYKSNFGFNYAFNYSTVHVLMLNPWNFTVGGYFIPFTMEQLAWIEMNLQNAHNMKYKIIALHPPVVYKNQIVEEYAPLISLCDKYGVDAVFFGHAHEFDQAKINNTQYLLVGVGGNSVIGPTGFAQVDVTSTHMQIDMHWLNGSRQALATIHQ